MFIDTHAHLDAQAFETDLEEVLDNARQHKLEAILTIGVTAATSVAALNLAKKYSQLHAVVGIQPNYVAEAGPEDFDLVVEMVSDPHVVAIGETGLDRYWDSAPIELQQEFFRKHIELSQRVQKPFIVHNREADADVVALMQEVAAGRPLVGVMHSFCGDAATAEACLELGLHISFAGMLTFKSNQQLRDVAKLIPLERLLIETDSPYLAPVPMRGKRNEPSYVVHTAQCLANLHEMPLEEMATLTTANAKRLFRI
ncbi:TatD family hydrolase [Planctomicrobium sp. SH668]|uniref:TatD family hydrolase n=1 Tax=Planctomicrobium sp. SH668 TaxID=3448126 RepID=UPI003F5C4A4F